MYLTAQRVRSKAGQEGINAFLHQHRDQHLPLKGVDEPDIDQVSRLVAGYPVAASHDVPPGNNQVIAYLDLVAADTVPQAHLQAAVAHLHSRIGLEPLPISVGVCGVAARFGALPDDRQGAPDLHTWLESLRDAALALLTHRNDPPRQASGAYVVWASSGADGVRLWLPPATLARLPQPLARRMRVLVPHEVLQTDALDALQEVASFVLGLDEAQLRQHGVEIVDPSSAKILARYWPSTTTSADGEPSP